MTLAYIQSLASRCLWTLIITPFVLLPLVFVYIVIGEIVSEHRKFTTFQPTQATILSAETKTHRGSKKNRTSYSPLITFRYTVDDHAYTSDRATMIKQSGSSAWAAAIVKQYPVSSASQAWYDPANPADAFLVRRYSPMPYAMLLFSMPFVAIFTFGLGGGVVLMWWRGADKVQTPKSPKVLARPLILLIAAGVWYAVGFSAVSHYFLHANDTNDQTLYWGLLVYVLLGLLPLYACWRDRKTRSRMAC